MKRIPSFVAALVVAAGVVIAETDYVALPIIKDIQQGADNANQIVKLRIGGVLITNTAARLNAAASGGGTVSFYDLTVTGESKLANVAAAGNVTLGDIIGTDRIMLYGLLSLVQNAQTITNGGALAASYPLIVVNSGIASNNITVPQATFAGQTLTVMGSASLTNVVVILDTAYQAGDFTVGPNDTISYVANSTSNFVETARANN